MVSRLLTAPEPGSPTAAVEVRPGRTLGRVDLWFSRHVATGLVAMSLVERGEHPARRAGMPRQVRVVDEPTGELVERLLREAAASAGVPLRVDLDAVVSRAERATHLER